MSDTEKHEILIQLSSDDEGEREQGAENLVLNCSWANYIHWMPELLKIFHESPDTYVREHLLYAFDNLLCSSNYIKKMLKANKGEHVPELLYHALQRALDAPFVNVRILSAAFLWHYAGCEAFVREKIRTLLKSPTLLQAAQEMCMEYIWDGRCSETVDKVLSMLGESQVSKVLPVLIAVLNESEYPSHRRWAAREILCYEDEDALELVRQAYLKPNTSDIYSDDDESSIVWNLRTELLEALKKKPHPSLLALFEVALEDSDEFIRMHGLDGMRKSQHPDFLQKLFAQFAKETHRDNLGKIAKMLTECLKDAPIPADFVQVAEEKFPRMTPWGKDSLIDLLEQREDTELLPLLQSLLTKVYQGRHVPRVLRLIAKRTPQEALVALPHRMANDQGYNAFSAASILGRIATDSSLQCLLEGFKTAENESLRIKMLHGLAESGQESAIGQLLEVLLKEPSYEVAQRAGEGLVSFGDMGLDALVASFAQQIPEAQQKILPWLHRFPSPLALSTLLEAFQMPALRGSAARGLGLLDAREAIPVLLETLPKEEDIAISHAIMDALEKFQESQCIAPLCEYRDKLTGVDQWFATLALLRLGMPEAIEESLQIWRTMQDPDASIQPSQTHQMRPEFLLELWGELQIQEALPILREALNDGRENVRFAAIEALGKLKDTTLSERLTEIRENDEEDWEARLLAAEALVRLGDFPNFGFFYKGFMEGKTRDIWEYSWLSARAVGCGTPKGWGYGSMLMEEGLYASDPFIRETITDSLGPLQAPGYIKAALQDGEASVRILAVQSAIACHELTEEVEQLLSEMHRDPDAQVRRHVAQALVKVNPQLAKTSLEHLLEDSSWMVRLEAAIGLASLGSEAGEPVIQEARQQDFSLFEKALQRLISV